MKHIVLFFRAGCGVLASIILLGAACARANVTTVGWYRLGENDGSLAPGDVVKAGTADLLRVDPLRRYGSPLYSDLVARTAANELGSSLSVLFNGSGQFLSNAIVTGARNNFGIEAWVAVSPSVQGSFVIAHNGNTFSNGWGLGVTVGFFGTTTYYGELGGGIKVASSAGRPGAWTHVALVRDSGTNTFYLNGEPATTLTNLGPGFPVGGFAIAGTPQAPHGGYLPGLVDEVRVFTFAAGQFSPDDLLLHHQLPGTLPPGGIIQTGATLEGEVNSLGLPTTAWFEWDTSTNFANATPPQDLGSGFTRTNFSEALAGLSRDTIYYYRSVSSNRFGIQHGAEQAFTLNPSVATLFPAALSGTSAALSGVAAPKGVSLSGWFEWGLTTNYGNVTAPQPLGNGSTETNFSAVVTNLFPGATIYYRALAADGVNLLAGTNVTFVAPGAEFDRVIPATVNVTIQPPDAVADGARWMLDGGPAQPPGIPETTVAPGHHTVSFGNLPKWHEPPAVQLFVAGGQTSEVSVVFSPLPTYDFHDVPEQQARPGELVEFFVTGASNVTLQASASPPPAGPTTFDTATGRFTYLAAPGDRLPFSLTFSTGGVAVATSLITPQPSLPNEEITINYGRPLPDEESRNYISISESLNPPEVFNDATNQTLTVDISGKTLVFDAAHPNNLHRQYNGRDNIREFRLYADKVTIRSPLQLPQTHVTVHARELRFEGPGLIDTTPVARRLLPDGVQWGDGRTNGYAGDPGHDGGDADIYVQTFHADPATPTPFILRGGAGGVAGEGRDGVFEGNGMFAPSLDDTNWVALMTRAGNFICRVVNEGVELYQQVTVETNVASTCGSQVPAYGEPAVPSGTPGAGGRGGTLRSTLDLSPFVDQAGGAPGASASNHIGGTLFFRYIYRDTLIRTVKGVTTVVDSDTLAPKLPGADAPAPLGAAGAAGSLVLTNPGAWLHSFAVRGVVGYAKDAYLDGHVAETQSLLADYRGYLEELQPAVGSVTNLSDTEFAETTSLDQLNLELETILHRIDSNLDFFGNPAGWVPLLSLEANLTAFEHEIDQSIPILYLAYWLNNAATNLQNSLAASGLAVDKLKAELNDMITAYNRAQVDIPLLKVQSDVINTRIAEQQTDLLLLQQQLLARAQQNAADRHNVPFWKKALGVLSVVADLVPVGQPVVGKIGAGLGLLAQLDPEHPVESAKSLTNAFDVFKNNVDIRVCLGSSATNSSGSATNAVKKDQLKQMTECGKFLKGELKEVAAIFKNTQVDKKEVQAELDKLKAADPVFQQAVAKLEELNKDKEKFAQELAAALQAVTTLTSDMAENTLATDHLENQVAAGLALLDHTALLHIKEMERRAKDRLLTFQYYVAQAFQYRVLQPYGGNLHLNRLFDQFQALIQAGNSTVLSPQDFDTLKGIYLADLQDTIAQTLTILNANAPAHSLPVQLQLTAADLQQLNTSGRLTLNLRDRGIFPSSHENIRLINLRTRALTAHPVDGSIGSFALLYLDFEHLGTSRVTAGGQTYLFRHYQTDAVNPITWNTVFDGIANAFSNSQLSPAAQSLLSVLLAQPTTNNLLLFAYPGADADIVIHKEVQTDNNIDLALDSLVIEVEYEFAAANSARPPLDVVVSDGLQPIIALSQADLNGRRDGQGSFHRIYPSGATVTLQAPATYGARPFQRWVLNNQPAAAGQTAVTVALITAMTAEAQYGQPVGIAPEIIQQPQDTAGTLGGAASFAVLAAGSTPLAFQWQKGATPLNDGGHIAGALTATLVITNLALSDAAPYSVVVSNSSGTLASRAALLTVTGPALVPTAAASPGSFGFYFSTVPGLSYIIEQKPTLDTPTWTTVQVLTGTGGVLQFSNPPPADSSFYRLRVQ
ncbi:MAG TPA: LamG-like jellyroll fold domain-containing protein [Verrucomicrobiae bacterium]